MNRARSHRWLVLGAVSGGLAVAAGAFGAHGLKAALGAEGGFTPADAELLSVWETAARYQMYHALALLALGLVAGRQPTRCARLAGAAFVLGTCIFSGCLYALVLTGQKWLGGVVPIGGTLLIVGWVCLAIAAFRLGRGDGPPPAG